MKEFAKQLEEMAKELGHKIQESKDLRSNLGVVNIDNHDCHASPEDGCACVKYHAAD